MQCNQCHKPTWAGCGAHVEQVLGHVAVADRCTCRDTAAAKPGAGLGAAIRKLFGK
ncbi:MAG TPA: hypothetical protein VFP84_32015 [Kofleriaceae bacterium]|nr:hypothetical protein [Kofleriaceae bacterium]